MLDFLSRIPRSPWRIHIPKRVFYRAQDCQRLEVHMEPLDEKTYKSHDRTFAVYPVFGEKVASEPFFKAIVEGCYMGFKYWSHEAYVPYEGILEKSGEPRRFYIKHRGRDSFSIVQNLAHMAAVSGAMRIAEQVKFQYFDHVYRDWENPIASFRGSELALDPFLAPTGFVDIYAKTPLSIQHGLLLFLEHQRPEHLFCVLARDSSRPSERFYQDSNNY